MLEWFAPFSGTARLAVHRPRMAYLLQARLPKAIAAGVGLMLAAGSGHGLGSGQPRVPVSPLAGAVAALDQPGAGRLGTAAGAASRVAMPRVGGVPMKGTAHAPTRHAATRGSLRPHAGWHAAFPAVGLPAGATLAMGVQTAVADLANQLASDQIKALEQQVEQVLAEARRQQVQLAQQRHRLATAEAANTWLPWLLLGGLAVGGLAIWLALRVRRLQHELDRRLWTQAEVDLHETLAPGGVLPGAPLMSSDQPLLSQAAMLGATTMPDLTIAQPRRVVTAAPVAVAAPSKPHEFSLGTGVPPRPVSVEELLDLDQQVDFFIALGQAQSAIDLLLSHVRSTGGTNALPYFKLLEIYRSQGDEEAYERTRERFNQRFNAFAPDWDGDLASGRLLEDYPEVVQRIQKAWLQPLRAVAELDALLLRRADLEPFDLPAYRDVLMLQALVRDLPAGTLHAATTTVPKMMAAVSADPALAPAGADDTVDLLLPLDDGPLDITMPRPHVPQRSSAQAMLAEWVFTRATQPWADAGVEAASGVDAAVSAGGRLAEPSRPAALDLDLSDLAPAPREFTRPAAFNDIDLRRDSHRSDLGALEEGDLVPPLSRR